MSNMPGTECAEASRLPARTWLLASAQSVHLTCAVLSVTVAAAAGIALAPSDAWATTAYGAQFASAMACTFPAAKLIRRVGARPVFLGSCALLFAAGLSGMQAMHTSSFVLLVLAHVLLGAYVACAGFYRFVAADNLPASLQPRAISLVVAGGIVAALSGPALASWLSEWSRGQPSSWMYAAFMPLSALAFLLVLAWKPDAQPAPASPRPAVGPMRSHGPTVMLAIGSGAVAYLLMNLLMVQSTLVLRDLCSFQETARAVQVHVLAMFLPSFFTGFLLQKMRQQDVLAIGFVLLSIAAAFGTRAPDQGAVVTALVFLGIGWNLLYVGSAALLTRSVRGGDARRWQGLHDTAIAACATVGAFAPAPLLVHAGWSATNAVALLLTGLGFCACIGMRRRHD